MKQEILELRRHVDLIYNILIIMCGVIVLNTAWSFLEGIFGLAIILIGCVGFILMNHKHSKLIKTQEVK